MVVQTTEVSRSSPDYVDVNVNVVVVVNEMFHANASPRPFTSRSTFMFT
jgi:hypothetical protein